MKNPERIHAERMMKTKADAVRNWNGTDEADFLRVDAEYWAAVRLLVDMEMKWPTEAEKFRKRRFQQMASRGVDVYR